MMMFSLSVFCGFLYFVFYLHYLVTVQDLTTFRMNQKLIKSSLILSYLVTESKNQGLKRSVENEDLNVVTVLENKVYLRTGASEDDSPLMAVTKDTRLVVEANNNGWLRVIAPNGVRAWIREDLVG